MPELSEAYFRDAGYLFARQCPNGVWIGVQQMLFTYGLMVGLGSETYEHRYCYETLAEVLAAYLVWDGEDDPPGLWIKNKGRGRDRLNPRWLEASRADIRGSENENRGGAATGD